MIKIIPAVGQDGKSSRVSAVYQAEPRGSFIAAMKDVKEVWGIPYTVQPQKSGWRQSNDSTSAGMVVGARTFPVRQISADDFLDDSFFDWSYKHLISTTRDSRKGHVLDLDTGRKSPTWICPACLISAQVSPGITGGTQCSPRQT